MKTFTTTFNGYSKKEVNDFISEVIYEYERLFDKLKAKDIENNALKEKIASYKNIENGLSKAVIVAKQKLRLYKARMKKTIEEQLAMVDDIDNIEY